MTTPSCSRGFTRLPIDVLVVDDSDSQAEITLLAIRRVAPRAAVVRCKDGEQALHLIFGTDGYANHSSEIPGMILLEVDTPSRNGLQVLDQLRSSPDTNEIPVIMLSSTDRLSAIERSYALGARGYIVKPADPDLYCAKVGEIVGRWLPSGKGSLSAT
jgi:two-component system, response regulator